MAVTSRRNFLRGVLSAALPALVGLCALPALARAGWQDFIPTPARNSAALEAGGFFERDETDTGTARQARDDLFFKEKLTFVSDGYSYHPRFIQYHLLLAVDLTQETCKSDAGRMVSTNASAFDYDLRLSILPEHPYKLKLFASRVEPLYRQYFSSVGSAVVAENGAMFSYRNKPYFLNLRYSDRSSEWSRGMSDLKIYGINGLYFKDFTGGKKLSFSSFYDHWASRSSSGSDVNTGNYGVGNTIDLNVSSLQSSLSRNVYRPQTKSGGPDSGSISWLELLNLRLPLHLRSLLTYRYHKYDQEIAPGGETAGRMRSVSYRDLEWEVIHKLYQSLETTYRLYRHGDTSTGGESASTSNSLGASYAKSVPGGHLNAGASLSRMLTDSVGRTTVADETHAHLGLNEVFTTLQNNADCGSIAVFLTDHAAGNQPIAVDFVAVPSPGARCDIQVTGIPADFDETASHDYTISYVLETGSNVLQTDTYGYNASLNLFNNNLNPYFSRTVISEKVVSGDYLGSPFDGTVSTVGLILGGLPVRLLGEYYQRDGSTDSFRRWRGAFDFDRSVTTTTHLTFKAEYISTRYPEGSTVSSPQAYTAEETRLSANLQQRLFKRSLLLSGGGSYSSFQGLMKSSGYTLQANLQWKIGKTTITGGANGYSTRSSGQQETESFRGRQYYYLSLRRELF